jgi:hypothetical protein
VDLPPITGDTPEATVTSPIVAAGAPGDLRAAFGVALHVHQPTVLSDGDATRAALISNLERMFEHPGEGDNHNASGFLRCYGRTADLVGGLLARGLHPRAMLDYSGNLLWGLAKTAASTSRPWPLWASANTTSLPSSRWGSTVSGKRSTAPGPGAADQAIARLCARDPSFNLDRASWTNDRSWVAGYADLMDPVLRLSARFHTRWDGAGQAASDATGYRRSLLYLLLSQTSCFRYWGHGYWTDVAQEICRRGFESLDAAT